MQPNSRKFLATVIAIVVAASLAAKIDIAAAQSSAGSSAAAIEVQITHPTRGTVTRWLTLPGNLHALQETTLYAKVPGYLKSISVDKGDAVKAGQVIAVIEAPELIADQARYRAEAEAAKAEYNRIQEAVKQAPDLVMAVEVDRAKGKYEVAKANLERNQTLLEFAKITAPFPGLITKRYVDLGAFIPAATSGSTAQTAAIVTLMNFLSVRVQVAVPEFEASLVTKALPVRFTVEGLSGRTFEGKITRYSYALDESSKTMLAEIEIPNPKLELRPGMYASVQIGIEHHDGVTMVPSAALLMEKTNASVFTLAGNVAKKRAVKIGFNDGKNVEILDGLKADEAVILLGKRSLTDGQSVQATEAK